MSNITNLFQTQVKNLESAASYDLVIVGGGLIGASLLLALKTINAPRALKIALIEPKNIQGYSQNSTNINNQSSILDQRSLVLNLGSKLYYQQLGVWEQLQNLTTLINKIIVSEQGSFSKVFLDSRKLQVDGLGYVVNIDVLNQTIWQCLSSLTSYDHKVDIISPYKVDDLVFYENRADLILTNEADQSKTISGKIIIGADGGRSYIRDLLKISYQQYDYKQTAVIANVTHELANKNTAYERFSEQGPCALLPRTSLDQATYFSGVVWPWPNDRLEYVKSLSKSQILSKLQKLFGYKLGKFLDIGELQFFPLWRVTSDQLFKKRVLLLGNAANHIHPVGGQGFNLGLRDVKCFSKLLADNIQGLISTNFAGDIIEQIFENYENLRTDDHHNLQNSTHHLLGLFSTQNKFLKVGRKIGMAFCNHSNLLTNLIADQSMGLNV